MLPVSGPPGLQTAAGNPEEEPGPRSGGGLIRGRGRSLRPGESPAHCDVHTHVELLDGRAAALVGGDDLDLHDLDGVGSGPMASPHVPV